MDFDLNQLFHFYKTQESAQANIEKRTKCQTRLKILLKHPQKPFESGKKIFRNQEDPFFQTLTSHLPQYLQLEPFFS